MMDQDEMYDAYMEQEMEEAAAQLKEKVRITINNDAEVFPIATAAGWDEAVGHRITVKNIDFAVLPNQEGFGITDVRSGMGIFFIKANHEIMSLDTKESMIIFLGTHVGPTILEQLDKIGVEKYERTTRQKQEELVARLGPKPEVVDFLEGEE